MGSIVDKLNAAVFPNAAALQPDSQLGRLTVVGDLNAINDPNADGKYEKILSYGGRSFSIYRVTYGKDRRGRGRPGVRGLTQVFDSAAQLEQISADKLPDLFNSEGRAANFDTRSDNKGPEPEGVAVGYAPAPGRGWSVDGAVSVTHKGDDDSSGGKRCLFLTTERLSVVFVYDISDPRRPAFQSIAVPPQSNPADDTTRLLAPEGITYARYAHWQSPRVSAVAQDPGRQHSPVFLVIGFTTHVIANLYSNIQCYSYPPARLGRCCAC